MWTDAFKGIPVGPLARNAGHPDLASFLNTHSGARVLDEIELRGIAAKIEELEQFLAQTNLIGEIEE